jgi:hypothetical protein
VKTGTIVQPPVDLPEGFEPESAAVTNGKPSPAGDTEAALEAKLAEMDVELASKFATFKGEVDRILAGLEVPVPATPIKVKQGAPLIYGLMAKVLHEMPPVGKDQRNQSQGFMFQGIEDILDRLNPILGRHGVFFVPQVIERLAETRLTGANKNLWTIHLLVRYSFFAPDGSSVVAETWGEGTDSGDKATSKAMTMAMKACLRQVFAISDHEMDDPDSTSEESRPPEPTAPVEPLSDVDRAAIQTQIDELGEKAAAHLKKLWIAQKGKLPGLKAATADHVPAILAMISEAEMLAEQDEVMAAAATPE